MGQALGVYYAAWMGELPLQTCMKMACSKHPYGDSFTLDWTLNQPLKKHRKMWCGLYYPIPYYTRPLPFISGYPRITRTAYAQ